MVHVCRWLPCSTCCLRHASSPGEIVVGRPPSRPLLPVFESCTYYAMVGSLSIDFLLVYCSCIACVPVCLCVLCVRVFVCACVSLVVQTAWNACTISLWTFSPWWSILLLRRSLILPVVHHSDPISSTVLYLSPISLCCVDVAHQPVAPGRPETTSIYIPPLNMKLD